MRWSKQQLPALSAAERDALAAGSVGLETAIFRGHWLPEEQKAFQRPASTQPGIIRSPEEQAFWDGPLNAIMTSGLKDADQEYRRGDLSEETWKLIRESGILGMALPKAWGGLDFSSQTQRAILEHLAGVSAALSVSVAVPNSLGPGELLVHYGTDEQQKRWLPGLANGTLLPCFGLTGTLSGSDAAAMVDEGTVLQDESGQLVLEIHARKRYITLAPIADLVGLAIRVKDPEGLLSQVPGAEPGITLVILERGHPGLILGPRHDPLGVPFMNGTVSATQCRVPLNQVIGGGAGIGKGWKMLMDCLSIGRGISLPALSAGGGKLALGMCDSYLQLRRQFGLPLADFEGIQERWYKMIHKTIAMDVVSEEAARQVDEGRKPMITAALAKQYVTEWGREVVMDAMDVMGGKGIILGPKNRIGRFWQSTPISITVEGANLMTRALMVFGMGSVRSHPRLPTMLQAMENDDVEGFKAIAQGWVLDGLKQTLGTLKGMLRWCPGRHEEEALKSALHQGAAQVGLWTTGSLVWWGGGLKRKEALSGHLADAVAAQWLLFSWSRSRIRPLLPEALRYALVAEWDRQRIDALRRAAVEAGWPRWLAALIWGSGLSRKALSTAAQRKQFLDAWVQADAGIESLYDHVRVEDTDDHSHQLLRFRQKAHTLRQWHEERARAHRKGLAWPSGEEQARAFDELETQARTFLDVDVSGR